MKLLDSLLQKKRDELAEIRHRMTDVVFPTKSDIDQIWETQSKGLPPGTNLIMYNAKRQQYSRITVDGQFFITPKPRLRVHPSQALMKRLNDVNLEILLCNYFQSNSREDKIYSTTSCSLLLYGQEYESYQIISKAISFDQNNYPVQYLKWFVPLGRCSGIPLTSFFDFENKQKLGIGIKKELRQFNIETLNAIGFSKRQLEVMNLYVKGFNSNGVAERLSLSSRTVEKHNQQILSKAKLLFLFHRFRTAMDVVHLLDDLGMFL